jgi:DNA-binding NtrC family response regulator
MEQAHASTDTEQASCQLRPAVEEFEKQFLRNALAQNDGCKTSTAAMLGIDRKTLYSKLKKYGILEPVQLP